MKETYYFSHDYNARRDTKINALIRKHGMLGYGVFWSIIEDLYQNNNSMPCDYELIAYDLRIDADKVKSIITEFDLFVIEDGNFGSKSVEDRLDKRSEKSKKARDNARKRWGDQDKTTMAEECLFYVLRIYDDNEEFIKCGITTESVSRRYSGKLNGYNYELLMQFECDLSIGLAIENKIRLSCENYDPSRKFGGYLECYKINQFKYIKEELIKCECKVIAENKIRNAIKESKVKERENESKEKECINTTLSPAIAPTPSPKNYKKATMSEIIKTFDRVNKTSSDFEDFAGDYALTAIGFYELFDNNIKAAGGKATVLQKAKGTWIDDIRQICEKDGYNLNDLREAYTFLTHDLFWQKNILSAQTLRKQMDKLKMAIKSEKEKAERTAQKTGVKVGDPRFCTDWSKSHEEYHLGF